MKNYCNFKKNTWFHIICDYLWSFFFLEGGECEVCNLVCRAVRSKYSFSFNISTNIHVQNLYQTSASKSRLNIALVNKTIISVHWFQNKFNVAKYWIQMLVSFSIAFFFVFWSHLITNSDRGWHRMASSFFLYFVGDRYTHRVIVHILDVNNYKQGNK